MDTLKVWFHDTQQVPFRYLSTSFVRPFPLSSHGIEFAGLPVLELADDDLIIVEYSLCACRHTRQFVSVRRDTSVNRFAGCDSGALRFQLANFVQKRARNQLPR